MAVGHECLRAHNATSPRAQLSRALDDAVAGLDAGRAVLLLALDLDDFRRYNAEHGYDAGDALLARSIRAAAASSCAARSARPS
jgi:GGDEF domain-containing protein